MFPLAATAMWPRGLGERPRQAHQKTTPLQRSPTVTAGLTHGRSTSRSTASPTRSSPTSPRSAEESMNTFHHPRSGERLRLTLVARRRPHQGAALGAVLGSSSAAGLPSPSTRGGCSGCGSFGAIDPRRRRSCTAARLDHPALESDDATSGHVWAMARLPTAWTGSNSAFGATLAHKAPTSAPARTTSIDPNTPLKTAAIVDRRRRLHRPARNRAARRFDRRRLRSMGAGAVDLARHRGARASTPAIPASKIGVRRIRLTDGDTS